MRNLQPILYSTGKNYSFPHDIKNKTEVPTFPTFIQHSIGRYSHSQKRKRNKTHPNWKEESISFLFADDMRVYIKTL